jgi:H+/Cl- antiporter ClcA
MGLGQFVADAASQTTAVPFAILGMRGYLAGVTQAPRTSFVIVMEMATQHEMVLPLMITAATATAASKPISPPLYQTLAHRYAELPETRPPSTQGRDVTKKSIPASPRNLDA